MKCVTAKKEHRCDSCGHRIPIGARYWQKHESHGDAINFKEHTNCLEYEREPELPEGFNKNRPNRKGGAA